jgi:hypothetical protein
MLSTRRQFVDSITLGATAFAAMPAALVVPPGEFPTLADAWDTRWPSARRQGAHRVRRAGSSGYGVWRATIWGRQYEQVLGVLARDLDGVGIRHTIACQGFWDRQDRHGEPGDAPRERRTHEPQPRAAPCG